jgi:nicotinamidase-related amidase
MPARPSSSSTLHGNVGHHSRTALVLIDVLNPFEFPGAHRMLREALPAARRIARLRKRAAGRGIPVIYANDNFGQWRSNLDSLVKICLEKPGRQLVRLLLPSPHDYFVLKPKNSAFYATSLDLLLQHIGVQILVLTGFAGNNCVLFTANDAYMRDYRIHVPRDCIASVQKQDNTRALRQMRDLLKADISVSSRLRFRK